MTGAAWSFRSEAQSGDVHLRGMWTGCREAFSQISSATTARLSRAAALIVDQFASVLPEDVCTYIRQIHRRDVLRNERLAGQLEEAVIAIERPGSYAGVAQGAGNATRRLSNGEEFG